MKTSRKLTSLALAVVVILLPTSSGHAYTLQFTNTGGTVKIKWPTNTITVALSTSLITPSLMAANIKPGSDVEGAARRALQHWSEASNLSFNILVSPAQAVGDDGINLITVAPVNLHRFTNEAQGKAFVTTDNTGSTITDADVAINPNPSVQFSTDGTVNTFDLESTFTHEIGHLLGLEHSGVVGATMQPRQGPNGLFGLLADTARTLSDDDRAGIRTLYGSLAGLGSITGSVRFNATSGTVAFGAHVFAEEVSTGRVMAGNIALQSGAYRIDGLAPGQYRVVAEYLNEPVNSNEIASRNGAYAGMGQSPSFQTVEAGQVTVTADAVATLNIVVSGMPFVNPTFVGANGQLSTINVPIVPGRTMSILVGGDNVHSVAAEGVSVTSPFITVNQASFQQLFIGTLQVLSFDITVDNAAPPGDYSIRLVSGAGEITCVTGGLTIETQGSTPPPSGASN